MSGKENQTISSNNLEDIYNTNDIFNHPWSEDQEKILKSWGDKASCYKLMHDRAHKRFWALNAWFSIPIIIFSTLTGTGNFAQETFSDNIKHRMILAIGSINLFSAILLAIKGFLNVAEKGEAHRLSSVDWDKLGRKIRVELSKNRENRQNCKFFVDRCQEEYNRLVETQLSIPADIIRWFNKLIETGEYDYNKGGCAICIHDMFCFPFGLPMCECRRLKNIFCSKCCCPKKENEKRAVNLGNKSRFNELELPEIVGRIIPTYVSGDSERDGNYSIYPNV